MASSLTDKQSIYGPKNDNGKPGIGTTSPGSGGANSPDNLAKEMVGGFNVLGTDPKASKYDLDLIPKKYSNKMAGEK